MRYSWASATDTGRVRDHNEDAAWPEAPGDGTTLLAAVADGMGGHVGGEVASRLAIDTAIADEGGVVARLEAANDAVIAEVRERPTLAGMGTTLTLVILGGDGTADIGHIGDSRAYLLRDRALRQLTKDHSLVWEMVAAGEISAEQATRHPYRSVITRAIGIDTKVEIDHETVALEQGDRLLLCSDGLNGELSDATITQLLCRDEAPSVVAELLVREAVAAGGADNVSVVVVDVSGDEAG